MTQPTTDSARGVDAFVYPWPEAPEWAMWAATDAGGGAWWYDREPTIDIEHMVWGVGPNAQASPFTSIWNSTPCPTWRDSLRARPVGGVEDERAAFEAWAKPHGFVLTRENGAYTNATVACMCDAWRAAKRSTPPQVEPVSGGEAIAWQGIHEPWDLWLKKPEGIAVRPLYTHPAPVCGRVAGEVSRALLLNALERAFHAGRDGENTSAIQSLLDEVASTLAPTALNGGE